MKPLRFCIAPDKFKGSLTASEAAGAIVRGIKAVIPDADCRIIPLADGGEGTQEAFLSTVPGRRIECAAMDGLRRVVTTNYVRLDESPTAVVEIAASTGMLRLTEEERNPLLTSSLGSGMVIRSAVEEGAETVLIGLGGSSTNDAGCGVAHAFGWRFLDDEEKEIFPIPAHFLKIRQIVPPVDSEIVKGKKFIVLADVTNPLLGERGCSRVYAAQKGADSAQIEELEIALTHLAEVVAKSLGRDLRNHPGAGAAGGLGFGLMTFLDAALQPGFETIANFTHMEKAIVESDWIITGEGRLDDQSLEGKGPVALAKMARRNGRPVIALAGAVDASQDFSKTFTGVFSIANRPMTLAESTTEAASLLEFSSQNVVRLIASSFAS